MNLFEISEQVKACTKCPLREGATQPVPGIGVAKAKYFIIGEAPGAEEDSGGVPFVGRAGERLNRLLKLAGIDLNDCYLTNTVHCRPPRNRDPRKKERLCCLPFLQEELRIIKPAYIIALGSIPAALFTSSKISDLHGTMETKHFIEYDDGSIEMQPNGN